MTIDKLCTEKVFLPLSVITVSGPGEGVPKEAPKSSSSSKSAAREREVEEAVVDAKEA